ncbi:MAG: hypothetical protein LKJ47_04915 [Bifidobacteriaceae bacterium]|nr:hypothetical protein [Bifidobacteriaceae bacterium]
METFAKLDSKLYLNPKWIMFSTAHPLAAVVWVGSITYCVDNLTDGFIPDMIATRVLGADSSVAQDLEEADMWERVNNGWQVHDFLSAQRSRKEVESLKKARSEAGKAGGRKSGEARRSKAEAGASHVVEATSNQTEPDTDTDTDTTTPPTPSKGVVAADSKSQANRFTDEAFDDLWDAYPKHSGSRLIAQQAFTSLSGTITAPILLESAKTYAIAVSKGEVQQRYVPNLSNWLSKGQWRDWKPKAKTAQPVSDGWIQDHVTLKLPPGADAWAANKRFRQLVKTGLGKEQAAEQTIKESANETA